MKKKKWREIRQSGKISQYSITTWANIMKFRQVSYVVVFWQINNNTNCRIEIKAIRNENRR